jgi:plastocyanin
MIEEAFRMRPRTVLLILSAILTSVCATAAADFTVVQKNKEFSVRQLTLKAGDQLTFVNSDTVTHNVYSPTKGLAFEIELQPPGRSDTVRFSRPGVAEVICAIHPNMKLRVDVKE